MCGLHKSSSPRWSIVLAGGEGPRTKPFIEKWLGYPQPKQFCSFVGTRSILRHTWNRAERLTHHQQKVTVVSRTRYQSLWDHLKAQVEGQTIFQPSNRDTAAGIFLPLTYIRKWEPDATVVVYPSDHFVYPEDRFVDTVWGAMWSAGCFTERIMLIGVEPTDLEWDYGWIRRGQELGWSAGLKVHTVEAFSEKPSHARGRSALRAGALWNTPVFACKVETLWKLGHATFSDLMEGFEKLERAIGTPQEGMEFETVCQSLLQYNFSSDLLQKISQYVGVIELTDVFWRDWGQPERMLETLQAIGKEPAFPEELVCPRVVYQTAS